MFELPEIVILARQVNETLANKTIKQGSLGNSPHKFVWYNRTHAEFAALTAGKTVGKASAKGRWLFVPLEPGYVLVLGECGGKVLYHPAGAALPKKYHLLLSFADGSFFSQNGCEAERRRMVRIDNIQVQCYACSRSPVPMFL